MELNDPKPDTLPALSSSAPTDIADLFSAGRLASTQRAIAEFLAGRPVVIVGDRDVLVLPVESLTPALLSAVAQHAGSPLELFVSSTRAAVLGTHGIAVGAIGLPAGADCERVLEIASHADVAGDLPIREGDATAAAAIELTKLARLLPATLAIQVDSGPAARAFDPVPRVRAPDVLAFRASHARSLRLVSSARVPLAGDIGSTFKVFRDDLGQFWTAVMVGAPDPSRPVPVRLHSACLTGDVFGSLRCDCGDQLDMSVAAIAAAGGGVLLYLDQEGCGIGLGNKMRAYTLQENGLDTIDANTTLGFERDERRYDIAARMLRLLGIERVALLTNNPVKMSGLRDAGIEIVERIPLIAPVNTSNARYLEAKKQRAGHLIGIAGFATAGLATAGPGNAGPGND